MSLPKHIKEHIALGFAGLGANVLTVGSGGKYSTLASAAAARRASTILTQVGSCTLDESARFNHRSWVWAAGDDLIAYAGQLLAMKVGSLDPILVYLFSGDEFVAKYSRGQTGLTGLTCTFYTFVPGVIWLLDGHKETTTGVTDLTQLHFTTIAARRGATLITDGVPNQHKVFDVSGSELVFDGIQALINMSNSGNQIFSADVPWNTQLTFRNCDLLGGGYDLIYLVGSANHGGVLIDSCFMQGEYDVLRAWQGRDVVVRNSHLVSYSRGYPDSGFNENACIAWGATSSGSALPCRLMVHNNTLESIGEMGVTNSSNSKPVDIRNFCGSSNIIRIENNLIRAKVTGGTRMAVGVEVSSAADSNTPDILVRNNTFDVTNTGSGVTALMRSQKASYVIKEEGNTTVPGSVTDISTNVIRAKSAVTAYAASITPDAGVVDTVTIGALTGALTIAAPTNPVKNGRLRLSFTQDATGGRVITWNAAFKKAADGAGTANQVAATEFIYDGTYWVQLGGALAWA